MQHTEELARGDALAAATITALDIEEASYVGCAEDGRWVVMPADLMTVDENGRATGISGLNGRDYLAIAFDGKNRRGEEVHDDVVRSVSTWQKVPDER